MKKSVLRRCDGFTLVELGITLSVIGLIAVLAVASFMGMMRRNRISTLTREFVASANLARSEAVRRGSRVTICPSTDGAACVAGGSWSLGWIVFADPDNDVTVDAGEDVLQVHQAPPAGITMTGTGTIVSRITYNTRGQPEQNGTVGLVNAARTVTVALSPTGRLTTTAVDTN